MTTATPTQRTPARPQEERGPLARPESTALGTELNRLLLEARVQEERRRAEELARLREVQRFD